MAHRPQLAAAAVLLLTSLASAASPTPQAAVPAKQIFGAQTLPADLATRSIGFYSRGCLSGGMALPVDGPQWQVMRLSRNRNWGNPAMIRFLEDLARTAAAKDGWPGLLVGDISQPRGGPMLTGHASHQIGLDADIWLTPMPNRRLSEEEREKMPAIPVVEEGPHIVDDSVWSTSHFRLIKRAATDRRVERIFVAPGIKKKLCETETGDRAWLGKVRPYWGHNYHFHVRMSCPADAPDCRPQEPPPQGDGCGAELAYWYTDAPYAKPSAGNKPPKPPKPVTLGDLPAACRAVLASASQPDATTARDQFLSERNSRATAAPSDVR